MTLTEFTELLGIHGADLSKWPHDRGRAAAALVQRSEAARTALAEAAALDAALRADGAELSPERKRSLVEEIMEALESGETADDRENAAADPARRDRNRA